MPLRYAKSKTKGVSNFPMNVSIIVPSYNQGSYIRECIESLLRQPVKMEIFVFDSGSSDGTAELLKDYVGKIDFIIEKDLGQSHAINKGLEKARGDILGYLNSDDILLPDSIGKVLDFWAENPETDLLYGKAHYIDERSRVIGDYRTRIWDQAVFKGECFLCQPSCFWSRRIFKRIGFFDERLDCSLDYDYWLRIAESGGEIKYLDEYLSCSRDYPETKTRSRRGQVFREIFRLSLKRLGYVDRSWVKQWMSHRKFEGQSGISRLLPAGKKPRDALAEVVESLSYTLAKDTYFVEPVPEKVV